MDLGLHNSKVCTRRRSTGGRVGSTRTSACASSASMARTFTAPHGTAQHRGTPPRNRSYRQESNILFVCLKVPNSSEKVSEKSEKVPQQFQNSSPKVPKQFPKSSPIVPKQFPKSSAKVPKMSPKSSNQVPESPNAGEPSPSPPSDEPV